MAHFKKDSSAQRRRTWSYVMTTAQAVPALQILYNFSMSLVVEAASITTRLSLGIHLASSRTHCQVSVAGHTTSVGPARPLYLRRVSECVRGWGGKGGEGGRLGYSGE